MTNKTNRTRLSILNISSSLISQVVNLLVLFIARIFFIKILGVEILGINSLFESILLLLSLVDLGIGVAVSYSLYDPLSKKDTKRIVRLTEYYKKIYRIIAGSIFVIGLIIMPTIPLFIDTSIPIIDIYTYYVILLLSTSASYLFTYRVMIITADQRTYLVKIITTIFTVARVSLQVAAIVLWESYTLWLVIQLISTVGLNWYLSSRAAKLYPYIKVPADRVLDTSTKKKILSDIKSLSIYKVAGVVSGASVNIIGSVISGVATIGLYSNYFMIVSAVSKLYNTMLNSLTATLGNMSLSTSKSRQYEVFKSINLITFWLIGTISVGMLLVFNDVVTLWIGSESLFPNHIVYLIVVGFYLQATATPLWSFRDGAGIFRQVRYMGLFMAIASIVMSIVFGLLFGFTGVLIGAVAGRIVTVYWMEPSIIFKLLFKVRVYKYFIRRLVYASTLALSAVISYLLINNIYQIDVLSLIIKILIISAVSTLLFILFFYKSEESSYIRKIILKIHKKSNSVIN